MTQQPGGDIRWTSPAGHEHTTTPTNPFTHARTHEMQSAAHEGLSGAEPAATDDELAGVEPIDASRPELPAEPPWAARQVRRDAAA